MSQAYLILADGHIFEGESFGAEADAIGELVFTTGVVGYVETLSDPSYYGQIIMHTFPQMGNYGWIPEDMESEKSHMKGVVLREWCENPSNFRSQGTLDAYLKEQGIPGICGVDTREITQIIRESGVMNALITTKKPDKLPVELADFRIVGGVAATSVKATQTLEPEGNAICHVALLDYGAKQNIIRELLARKCRITVLPYNSSADDILATNADGIMLSNGPGDPEENEYCIQQIKSLLGKKPMFGICLGHQLMALAAGGKTEKLKYGHRGSNQPVRETSSGRVYITSQNHGYSVVADGLDSIGAKLSYVNANDGTCEGLTYPDKQAFSLQFHPEAHSGPRDMAFAFNTFINMMKGGAK